ncbi:MAG: DUF2029 domain-containing protein [Candidatus Kerfeldbacteria bacterium]|nr:DUF2029 domain-containing protein [Candidatus Kerfeldbacteria bacterium]
MALARPYIRVGQWGIIILTLPLLVALIISLVDDLTKKTRPGSWTVAIVVFWIAALCLVNLVTLPKQSMDEVLLTEEAQRGLVHGLNPYQRNFQGTIFDQWRGDLRPFGGIHPATEHYVYFPGQIVMSLPFFASLTATGWYDQRIVYFTAYFALLLVIWMNLRGSANREALVLAFALNPFFVFLFYGFNDLMVLFLFAAGSFCFARSRWGLGAVFFGAAVATKQTALITVAFMLLWLWFSPAVSRRSRIRASLIVVGMAAVIIGPFVLWSPSAFTEDTIDFFTSGMGTTTPGEGFGKLLMLAGWHNATASPLRRLVELAIVFSIIVWLAGWVIRRPSLYRAILAGAIGLAAIWFFSSYFLPAHAGVVLILITLAYLINEVEGRATSLGTSAVSAGSKIQPS